MKCEKGEVEMGVPVTSSPSLLSREDEHGEVRSFSWINEGGVVMNEPYLNILIAGFRADHSGSENKRLPY